MMIKRFIQIKNLPRVKFAHIFGIDSYKTHFAPDEAGSRQIEVCYITKGSLSLTLSDGTQVNAPAGSVICYLSNEDVHIEATAFHEHHTLRFAVPYTILDGNEPSATARGNAAESFGVICIPFVITGLPEKNNFLPLIDRIILTHTMHKNSELECSALVIQLLNMIDQQAQGDNDRPAYVNKKYVKRAKEYIFEHLKEPIYQARIAEHLEITPEYLCSIFKKSEGISIMHFINRVKLEQIRVLMQTSGITLAEASEIYGYTDPNYVSRLHRSCFGYTVTEAIQQEMISEFPKNKFIL